MKLSEYSNKYEGIQFLRTDGVLEMKIHTRGGSAKWGSSATCLHAQLPEAFLHVARDRENRVVILTGTGEDFIAEFDPAFQSEESTPAEMWPRIYGEGVGLLNNLLAIPVPMIAAVNGPALIHAELAVLCDIVLASETAEFADLAHLPNGVVPGDGAHTVWPMLLGPNRGRYFLLTGERIGAQEARRLGVVGEVLSEDALLSRAHTLATQLSRFPRAVLLHTRMLLVKELRKRMFEELHSGLAHEALATLTVDH